MAESKESRIKRLRRRRNAALRVLKPIRFAEARYKKLVKLFNTRLRKLLQPSVPGSDNGWHPDAERVPYPSLTFAPGYPKRGVIHTVEGFGLPSYGGGTSHPHFTLSLKTGKLWQHAPVWAAVKTLRHTESTETNRAGAIQFEITDAFAKDAQNWSDAEYARIAKLMRWIEKNAGVPRQCSVTFAPLPAKRLTNAQWSTYTGWLGHGHVPQNDHWDPGALKIDKLL